MKWIELARNMVWRREFARWSRPFDITSITKGKLVWFMLTVNFASVILYHAAWGRGNLCCCELRNGRGCFWSVLRRL
jgi:hypothetical protein